MIEGNSTDRSKAPEGEKEYDMENFYLWLPEGRHRRKTDPKSLEIIEHVDRLLEKHAIDGATLLEEFLETNRSLVAALDLDQSDPTRGQKVAEAEQRRREAQEKLYPVFEEMLTLGYSRETLKK